MDQQNNSDPSGSSTNVNDEPIIDAAKSIVNQQTPAPLQKLSHKKRNIFLILCVVVLLGIGAVVGYLLLVEQKDNTQATNSEAKTIQSEDQADTTAKNNKLVYAYKEGKKVLVREYDIQTGAKTDLFTYNEPHDSPSVDLSANNGSTQYYLSDLTSPDIDLKLSSDQYVYAADDGLYTRSAATATRHISRTSNNNAQLDSPPSFQPELDKAGQGGGPPGAYSLSNPTWTNDENTVGYQIGRYEGASLGTYNIQTKEASAIPDSFVYIVNAPKNPATLDLGPSEIMKLGFGETHYFKVDGLRADFVNETTAAGIYCPQRYSNDSDYSDCSKLPNRLLSIDLKTGMTTTLSEGNYLTVHAYTSEDWYLTTRTAAGTWGVSSFKTSTKSMTDVDLLPLYKDQGELVYVRLSKTSTPVAELYTKKGSGISVTVVDLTEPKKIVTLDLANSFEFTVLGY